MTLKVWCERCGGEGEFYNDDRSSLVSCGRCKGEGFMLVEAVQLPEGRCVVLSGGKVYEAEAVGHFDCTPTDAHCGVYRRGRGVRPMFRKDFVAVGLKEVGK
jgi:hypothetical protein